MAPFFMERSTSQLEFVIQQKSQFWLFYLRTIIGMSKSVNRSYDINMIETKKYSRATSKVIG